MRVTYKNIIQGICLGLLGSIYTLQAQKSISYPTYKEGMHIINPGQVGATQEKEAMVLIRSQWSGLENAPKRQVLSYGMPFGKNLSGGLSIINDTYHINRETDVFADFSYRLQVGDSMNLQLGLKAGGTFLSIDFMKLGLQDVAFSENVSRFNPNFGVGAFLQGEKYYVSLSIPRILNSKRHESKDDKKFEAKDKPQIYLGGGYGFDLGGDMAMKLTPSFMLRYDTGATTSIDLATSFELMNRFELGVSHRMKESFTGLLLVRFMEKFKIGYAYEAATSDIAAQVGATHEFLLRASF